MCGCGVDAGMNVAWVDMGVRVDEWEWVRELINIKIANKEDTKVLTIINKSRQSQR